MRQAEGRGHVWVLTKATALEIPVLQPGEGCEGSSAAAQPPFLRSPSQIGALLGAASAVTTQVPDGTQASPPGVGGQAHEGQMVFMVGRGLGYSEQVVKPQQPPYCTPQPFTASWQGKTQSGLDFIKQVYSHFRKTSSRMGNGLLIGWE